MSNSKLKLKVVSKEVSEVLILLEKVSGVISQVEQRQVINQVAATNNKGIMKTCSKNSKAFSQWVVTKVKAVLLVQLNKLLQVEGLKAKTYLFP